MIFGTQWFMAFFLILTPAGKVVGKYGYGGPATYEDCHELINHREMYLEIVRGVDPHFTLDNGHCDPVDKPNV